MLYYYMAFLLFHLGRLAYSSIVVSQLWLHYSPVEDEREKDCKLLNRSHYHLQQNPAILPVEQSKASSCSLVPCLLCSASALKKCANFGVRPLKGCCCNKELECADFDPSSYSIVHFLVFFWVVVVWLGSLLAHFLLMQKPNVVRGKETKMIRMGLSPGNSLQNCLCITGGRELLSV